MKESLATQGGKIFIAWLVLLRYELEHVAKSFAV